MYKFSFENGDFFPSRLTYCIHVSGKRSHGKRIFLKDALHSRDFWKTPFDSTVNSLSLGPA